MQKITPYLGSDAQAGGCRVLRFFASRFRVSRVTTHSARGQVMVNMCPSNSQASLRGKYGVMEDHARHCANSGSIHSSSRHGTVLTASNFRYSLDTSGRPGNKAVYGGHRVAVHSAALLRHGVPDETPQALHGGGNFRGRKSSGSAVFQGHNL
jgi:hypothetical protein